MLVCVVEMNLFFPVVLLTVEMLFFSWVWSWKEMESFSDMLRKLQEAHEREVEGEWGNLRGPIIWGPPNWMWFVVLLQGGRGKSGSCPTKRAGKSTVYAFSSLGHANMEWRLALEALWVGWACRSCIWLCVCARYARQGRKIMLQQVCCRVISYWKRHGLKLQPPFRKRCMKLRKGRDFIDLCNNTDD